MKIYIDSDYKCHTTNNGSYVEYDVEYFDGKCSALINGYRYIPKGHAWIREDGEEIKGESLFAWIDYSILEEAQTDMDNTISLEEASELMDEIEDLCNELIGE